MVRHLFAGKRSAAAAIGLALCGIFGVAAPVAAQVGTAIEYYLVGYWDDYDSPHGPYFVTAFPEEIAAVDRIVATGGWQHTGEAFHVWTAPGDGRLPTCRFWSPTFQSHFFTHHADECTAVRANPDWHFEGIAFYVRQPDADGSCANGSMALFRLYNNGLYGWILHRLSTSEATVARMLAAGWIVEGDARTRAFACVPVSDASGQ